MSLRPNVGFSTLSIVPSAANLRSAVSGSLGVEVGRSSRRAGRDSGVAIGGGMLRAFGPAIAATVATVALVGIGRAFSSGIRAASDLGESVNAVRVTFGDAADGVLALGRDAASTVGLSNSSFNGLAVQFSAFAKTIAGEGGNVVGTLQDLTGRAADFASVMNLDVSEAATLFQSGLAGETEPLRKFGIDLSAAAVEAYAYANGIATAGEELTEAQKVQGRYGLLMESTAATTGDFANTQFSLANGLRILGASWADVQAKLGAGFLPFAAAGVAGLNALMPVVANFATAFESFGARMQAVYDEAGGGGAGFRAMVDSIVASIAGFFAGADWASIFDALAASYLGYLGALGDLATRVVDALLVAVPAFVTFLGTLWIPSVLDEFVAILGTIATQAALLGPTVVGALLGILPAILAALLRMAPGLLTSALDLFGRLLDAVVATVPPLVAALAGVLPAFLSAYAVMAPSVLAAEVALFGGLLDGLTAALPALLAAVTGALPAIVGGVLALLPGLVDGALALFLGLAEGLAAVVPGILAALLGALPSVVATLAGMLPGLVDGALRLFLGLVEGLVQTVPALLVSLLGMLPQVLDVLLDALPALIVGAVALFVGLVRGLLAILPDLIGTLVVDVVPSLLSTLARMLPQLVEGAVLLFGGIVAGIAANLPTLVAAIARLIPDAIGGLFSWLPRLIEIGGQVLAGFAVGLGEKLAALVAAFLNLAAGPVDFVRDALGIRSPSRVFADEGESAVYAVAADLEALEAPEPLGPDESFLGRVRRAQEGRAVLYNYTQVGGETFASPEAAERAFRSAARHLRAV